MSVAFVTWSCVCALFLIIIMVRTLHEIISYFGSGKKDVLRIGSEREEFFIPGDTVGEDDYDYEMFD